MARSREAQLVLDLLTQYADRDPEKVWGTVVKLYESWGPPPRPRVTVEQAAAELEAEGAIRRTRHPTLDTYLVTVVA